MDKAIVDKVQKLLRLAQSSNPHEAANAAACAQELIDRHHLSDAMLEIADAAPALMSPQRWRDAT